MEKYDPAGIEKKWQDRWDEEQLYKTPEKPGKDKYYTLVMYPYPSGDGLHVGHVESYTAADIVARYTRMKGKKVLNPMGWDAFGLPAENYAIKTKIHPRITTEKAIENFRRQIKSLGLSYDWSREIGTHTPEYYKWTQWFFLLLYKKGLAERKYAKVNWCPKDQTVLANEQVVDGHCERCGTAVIQRDLEQWFFKITKYAEELLADLDLIDWPESTKAVQRHWIGKSEGAEIDFELKFLKNPADNERRDPEGKKAHLSVFTTRPDTLYGATYLVLSPEHLWVTLATDDQHDALLNADEVKKYVEESAKKTELERTGLNKDKTGVKIEGVVAINPATKEEIPIFVSDFVLAQYGTGALMAVPAHDERDFEFAQKFNLPIRYVVKPQRVDYKNPHRSRKEMTRRNIIIGIVRDPKAEKYLVLKWRKQPWTTFITGGVEEGEDIVEAAKREITEETGYKNLKLVRVLGGPTEAHFFAAHKDVNRITEANPILFEIENEERIPLGAEDVDQYDMAWLTLSQLKAAGLQHAESDIILSRLETGIDVYTGPGILINSGTFNGKENESSKKAIVASVKGHLKTTYRLRDWLVSRQRYWGAPIPIIYCEKCGMQPVPEKDLPVLLPDDVDFMPTGESPLARSKSFHDVTCPKCKGSARRESDTMDTFVCSSWYYFRFADPHNHKEFASKGEIKKWLPVDLYVGGAEHTVLHLLYSRFFTKALRDFHYVNFPEPFLKLRHQGIILAEDGRKMSKSLGNVVNPDDIVARFGADSMRLHEMFLGPLEIEKPWSTKNIIGVRRFIERVWKLRESVTPTGKLSKAVDVELNRTIKKVGEDIEGFKFNTAVSQLMILTNALETERQIPVLAYKNLLRILAPFAPHVTEELWESFGEGESIHKENWPPFDKGKLVSDTLTIAVLVSGKVRATLAVPVGAAEPEIESLARKLPELGKWMGGRIPKRVIHVPGKLVNFVL